MAFVLYPVADHGDALERDTRSVGQREWPLHNTMWLVLAFSSFAWVALIFACIEFL